MRVAVLLVGCLCGPAASDEGVKNTWDLADAKAGQLPRVVYIYQASSVDVTLCISNARLNWWREEGA
jgi:hypothetical protein